MHGLLSQEMPTLEHKIERGVDVFAEYTGRAPTGPTARSSFCADIARRLKKSLPGDWPGVLTWQKCLQPANSPSNGRGMRWACCHDRESFYCLFEGMDPNATSLQASSFVLTVEPCRLWPCLQFSVPATGIATARPACDFESHAQTVTNGWRGWTRIPFVALGIDPVHPGPLRINVRHAVSGRDESAWIMRHPWPYRLLLADDNPADLGWLFFNPISHK